MKFRQLWMEDNCVSMDNSHACNLICRYLLSQDSVLLEKLVKKSTNNVPLHYQNSPVEHGGGNFGRNSGCL